MNTNCVVQMADSGTSKVGAGDQLLLKFASIGLDLSLQLYNLDQNLIQQSLKISI